MEVNGPGASLLQNGCRRIPHSGTVDAELIAAIHHAPASVLDIILVMDTHIDVKPMQGF